MEQTFGHEGNLADQGWQPMPEPPKADEPKIYNSDSASGVREAANDLTAQRAERLQEPGYKAHDPEATIPRPYIYRGGARGNAEGTDQNIECLTAIAS